MICLQAIELMRNYIPFLLVGVLLVAFRVMFEVKLAIKVIKSQPKIALPVFVEICKVEA